MAVKENAARRRTAEGDDRSSLTASGSAARALTRDYGAHYFRWCFVLRFIKKTDKVLDVGCGVSAPLREVLIGTNAKMAETYVGVDLNQPKPSGIKWTHTLPRFDFVMRHKELIAEYGAFDVAVNYEVIEHMVPKRGELMVKGINRCLRMEGILLLSTPVFDGHQAGNHIHEYRIDELRKVIEKCGFSVQKRYGTYASYPVLKKVATPEHLRVLNQVREYYNSELSALFLAPLYPDASRNNLWILKKEENV